MKPEPSQNSISIAGVNWRVVSQVRYGANLLYTFTPFWPLNTLRSDSLFHGNDEGVSVGQVNHDRSDKLHPLLGL